MAAANLQAVITAAHAVSVDLLIDDTIVDKEALDGIEYAIVPETNKPFEVRVTMPQLHDQLALKIEVDGCQLSYWWKGRHETVIQGVRTSNTEVMPFMLAKPGTDAPQSREVKPKIEGKAPATKDDRQADRDELGCVHAFVYLQIPCVPYYQKFDYRPDMAGVTDRLKAPDVDNCGTKEGTMLKMASSLGAQTKKQLADLATMGHAGQMNYTKLDMRTGALNMVKLRYRTRAQFEVMKEMAEDKAKAAKEEEKKPKVEGGGRKRSRGAGSSVSYTADGKPIIDLTDGD